MKKTYIALIVIAAILLLWVGSFFYMLNEHDGRNSFVVRGTNKIVSAPFKLMRAIFSEECGSRSQVHSFEVEVTSKEQAAKLFHEFFSENGMYPKFNESDLDLVFYSESTKEYRYEHSNYILEADGDMIRFVLCSK